MAYSTVSGVQKKIPFPLPPQEEGFFCFLGGGDRIKKILSYFVESKKTQHSELSGELK